MDTLHILLVEDNEGDILITTESLHEATFPYELTVVTDGWEALQFVKKAGRYAHCKEPDVILLDINLPKLNGHEVLAQIKQDSLHKHIPTIMLSTSSSEKDMALAQNNQALSFITKPLQLKTLVNLLKTHASTNLFFTQPIN